MDSAIDWLAARTPRAPDELKAWLKVSDGGVDPRGGVDPDAEVDPDGSLDPRGGADSDAEVDPDGSLDPRGGAASVTESLLMAGLLHLEEAVTRPGRDREAAYRLLAADALITYGCEAASEAADIRGVLREVLGRVSSGKAVA